MHTNEFRKKICNRFIVKIRDEINIPMLKQIDFFLLDKNIHILILKYGSRELNNLVDSPYGMAQTPWNYSERVGFISIQIKLRNSAFQVPKQNRKCQILNFSIGDFYQSIQNSREYQEKMKLRRVFDDF